SLSAYDASGAAIVGPSAFQSPVTLAIQGDTAAAFSLEAGSGGGESLQIDKPTSAIALVYDGNDAAQSVTVQATVAGGAGAPSVSRSFTLVGKPPPPEAGPIYALNAGTNGGKGATVTVYGAQAQGDAAPVRTLRLSSKLYAQTIAVDAHGLLYVGFFDSALGFNAASGTPDAGNVVEVFAANAAGNDAPIETLTADAATGTTVFPSSIAFDPSGDVVTYGATNSNGIDGGAVLVYASESGAVAPAHAWNFATPVVGYPGPAGLALDGAGNFYVNGKLRAGFAIQPGVYVASAADRDNPTANAARTIPWDATTRLTFGGTADAVDSSGAIFVSTTNETAGSGSQTACQAQINVYASGAAGGTTDVPPVRTIAIGGLSTTNPRCSTAGDPLAALFPAFVVYGTSLYVASDFTNTIAVLPADAAGNVEPARTISGSSTHLNVPIAVAVGPATPAAARAFFQPTSERKRP
ncbi:MAG TPA: hypothetical protein VMH02_11780, partial [Verrucomicrobiae bacterium]|nr:hypothetical protein [Verrucomicrobiae bacterium]